MKSDLKEGFPFILSLFVCLYIVPHLLFLQEFSHDSIVALFLFTFIPLSASLIALMHVLMNGSFCPILILESVFAPATYLFKMELEYVLILSASALFVAVLEAFTLLPVPLSRLMPQKLCGLVSNISANKKHLALLTFWSIAMVGVVQISSAALPIWTHLLPTPCVFMILPLALLPFFRKNDTPLGIGGLIGVLVVFLGSIAISTTFYLQTRWYFSLGCVIASFLLMFLNEGIIALIRILGSQKHSNTQD